jgi:DNA repair exonuclease SbcCD ATPase subunit
VGLFDESNDQPLGNQGNKSGGGTDVLYGWLVGRAAADLGLAQALAASESQRKEQIKRLEDNLLGQIRELYLAQTSNSGAAMSAAEVDALKAEIERVKEQQHQFCVDQVNVEQLAAAIGVKLRDFEEQIQTQSQNIASGALGDLKLDFNLLADRVARAEFSTQQAQAAIERQPVEELVQRSLQSELAKLKAALLDELANSRPAENFSHIDQEELQSKIDELRGEIRQSASSGDELTELAGKYSRLERTTLQAAADLKAEIGALNTRLDSPATRPQVDETAVKRVEAALCEQIAALQEQLRATQAAIERQPTEELVQRSLQSELAKLKAALLDELANSRPAENFFHIDQEELQSKIDELRGEIRQSASSGDELTELAGRYSQLERTTLQAAADLKAEISALNSRLDSPPTRPQADETAVKRVEAALCEQIAALQEQLRATLGAVERRDGEVGALTQQLSQLSANMAALSSRTEKAAAQQLDQSAWVESIETLISAHLRDGENRLSVKLAQLEKTDDGLGRVQLELNALLNRVAQMELTQQQPATQQVQEIEASLAGKIEELRACLTREQEDRHGRDEQLNGLRGEMQIVVQRLVQAEADAQQSHALMVNEAAQAAQLREQTIDELSALQDQVSQTQERDSIIEGLAAELRSQISEVQNQLSHKLAMLDGCGTEIAELKRQVQHLTQLNAQKSAPTAAVASRPPSPIGINVGLGGLRPPAEAIPALTPMPSESESSGIASSQQTSASGPKDENRQLQQRLSADIERARAELRKRVGVGR